MEKTIMKNVFIRLILLCLLHIGKIVYSQSSSENYMQERIYLVPVTTTNNSAKQIRKVHYYDGLGRTKQVVNVKASPLEKDIVNHFIYDQHGRNNKEFLPIPQQTTVDGEIYTDPLSNATNVYGVEKIYSETLYDNSALNRVLQKKHVGNDWVNKPIIYNYEVNKTSDHVRKFSTLTIIENNASKSSLVDLGEYSDNQLNKTVTVDEDNNENIEFKNGQGKLLLSRKKLDAGNFADTYYVYNEYDQLSHIIPPLASIRSDISSNINMINELCYQYRYDGKSRVVEKKLPGKGWDLFVYDKQDRIVLTQDAVLATIENNFTKKGWLFTKYDRYGRIVYNGFFANTATRNSMQTAINNMSANPSNNESRSTVPFNLNGIDVYYTKNAFPTGSMTILSVSYYDSYPINSPSITTQIPGIISLTDDLSADSNTKNLVVASFLKNIEDDNWTKNYTYYDNKGRSSVTYSINYLGGFTKIEKELDFVGNILKKYTTHLRKPGETEILIKEKFIYDHQNRLVQHFHQVDNEPEELLAENGYNETNELSNKKTGNNFNSPLQSIDYKYNIRNWLTSINNPNDANNSNKLFGLEIKYNNPINVPISLAKYNGNVSQVDWKTATDGILRRYTYTYDGLNRLNLAKYSKPNSTVSETDAYNEWIYYDINGNIKHIERNGGSDNIQAQFIDEIEFLYSGNKLIEVYDQSENANGYPVSYEGFNPISYDLNGNMKDYTLFRIKKISYNHLNLPTILDRRIDNTVYGDIIEFKYRADGIKIEKSSVYKDPNVTSFKNINYLDGFQYESFYAQSNGGPTQNSNYILQFFPTSEGYYDYQKKRYIYQYKDQVGNMRLSYFRDNNGIAIVDKEINYYPFGLEHHGYNDDWSPLPSYKYGYQGQELQEEVGWISFKWRNSIPAIGRFFNIDPLSEKYPYQSHYNFSENRVVDGKELEGLEWVNNHGNKIYDTSLNDGKGDYTAFATANDRSIGDALRIRSDDGAKQFDQLVNSPHPITLDLNFKSTVAEKGYLLGKHDPKISGAEFNQKTGEATAVTFESAKITVNMGIINEFKTEIRNGTFKGKDDNLVKMVRDNKSVSEFDIAVATVGHEIGHSTPQNQMDKVNGKDSEAGPRQIGEKIMQDLIDWKSDHRE